MQNNMLITVISFLSFLNSSQLLRRFTATVNTSAFGLGDIIVFNPLTHSLTAALDQLRVVASTAEIYLLPVWKNKRPPHWNSTFNFDHHLNRQVILHQLAKLHRNRAIRGSVMASYQFSRWQQRRHNITSGFGLGDVALLRRPKSISKSNFVGITQSTAEILLLPI